MADRMKRLPDHEDEVHEIREFQDEGQNRVTAVAQFPGEVALAIVDTLAKIVRDAHDSDVAVQPDSDGITRAQRFEEGDVYMLASPFDGFFADRYLMDFYDVEQRDICSRMHLHTGLRFVRMMTGPGTRIRVSSLSPFQITDVPGVTRFTLEEFQDIQPGEAGSDERTRYNLVVPENSWVDMQIPRGVSHQFNAVGPNAVIDSVHPEESIETFREKISGYRMMAQTIFLAKDRPPAESCSSFPAPQASMSPASASQM
nr:hypothetical protein [Kibdelosporangium sp. MJ126-NF4]CEL13405.1 hypothetical protein [Kibdelosporangium sp. MJ126-NF4]CTQ99094.1 hypothetical protein [Kibdelosporangium sp. MJ126-NF4]